MAGPTKVRALLDLAADTKGAQRAAKAIENVDDKVGELSRSSLALEQTQENLKSELAQVSGAATGASGSLGQYQTSVIAASAASKSFENNTGDLSAALDDMGERAQQEALNQMAESMQDAGDEAGSLTKALENTAESVDSIDDSEFELPRHVSTVLDDFDEDELASFIEVLGNADKTVSDMEMFEGLETEFVEDLKETKETMAGLIEDGEDIEELNELWDDLFGAGDLFSELGSDFDVESGAEETLEQIIEQAETATEAADDVSDAADDISDARERITESTSSVGTVPTKVGEIDPEKLYPREQDDLSKIEAASQAISPRVTLQQEPGEHLQERLEKIGLGNLDEERIYEIIDEKAREIIEPVIPDDDEFEPQRHLSSTANHDKSVPSVQKILRDELGIDPNDAQTTSDAQTAKADAPDIDTGDADSDETSVQTIPDSVSRNIPDNAVDVEELERIKELRDELETYDVGDAPDEIIEEFSEGVANTVGRPISPEALESDLYFASGVAPKGASSDSSGSSDSFQDTDIESDTALQTAYQRMQERMREMSLSEALPEDTPYDVDALERSGYSTVGDVLPDGDIQSYRDAMAEYRTALLDYETQRSDKLRAQRRLVSGEGDVDDLLAYMNDDIVRPGTDNQARQEPVTKGLMRRISRSTDIRRPQDLLRRVTGDEPITEEQLGALEPETAPPEIDDFYGGSKAAEARQELIEVTLRDDVAELAETYRSIGSALEESGRAIDMDELPEAFEMDFIETMEEVGLEGAADLFDNPERVLNERVDLDESGNLDLFVEVINDYFGEAAEVAEALEDENVRGLMAGEGIKTVADLLETLNKFGEGDAKSFSELADEIEAIDISSFVDMMGASDDFDSLDAMRKQTRGLDPADLLIDAASDVDDEQAQVAGFSMNQFDDTDGPAFVDAIGKLKGPNQRSLSEISESDIFSTAERDSPILGWLNDESLTQAFEDAGFESIEDLFAADLDELTRVWDDATDTSMGTQDVATELERLRQFARIESEEFHRQFVTETKGSVSELVENATDDLFVDADIDNDELERNLMTLLRPLDDMMQQFNNFGSTLEEMDILDPDSLTADVLSSDEIIHALQESGFENVSDVATAAAQGRIEELDDALQEGVLKARNAGEVDFDDWGQAKTVQVIDELERSFSPGPAKSARDYMDLEVSERRRLDEVLEFSDIDIDPEEALDSPGVRNRIFETPLFGQMGDSTLPVNRESAGKSLLEESKMFQEFLSQDTIATLADDADISENNLLDFLGVLGLENSVSQVQEAFEGTETIQEGMSALTDTFERQENLYDFLRFTQQNQEMFQEVMDEFVEGDTIEAGAESLQELQDNFAENILSSGDNDSLLFSEQEVFTDLVARANPNMLAGEDGQGLPVTTTGLRMMLMDEMLKSEEGTVPFRTSTSLLKRLEQGDIAPARSIFESQPGQKVFAETIEEQIEEMAPELLDITDDEETNIGQIISRQFTEAGDPLVDYIGDHSPANPQEPVSRALQDIDLSETEGRPAQNIAESTRRAIENMQLLMAQEYGASSLLTASELGDYTDIESLMPGAMDPDEDLEHYEEVSKDSTPEIEILKKRLGSLRSVQSDYKVLAQADLSSLSELPIISAFIGEGMAGRLDRQGVGSVLLDAMVDVTAGMKQVGSESGHTGNSVRNLQNVIGNTHERFRQLVPTLDATSVNLGAINVRYEQLLSLVTKLTSIFGPFAATLAGVGTALGTAAVGTASFIGLGANEYLGNMEDTMAGVNDKSEAASELFSHLRDMAMQAAEPLQNATLADGRSGADLFEDSLRGGLLLIRRFSRAMAELVSMPVVTEQLNRLSNIIFRGQNDDTFVNALGDALQKLLPLLVDIVDILVENSAGFVRKVAEIADELGPQIISTLSEASRILTLITYYGAGFIKILLLFIEIIGRVVNVVLDLIDTFMPLLGIIPGISGDSQQLLYIFGTMIGVMNGLGKVMGLIISQFKMLQTVKERAVKLNKMLTVTQKGYSSQLKTTAYRTAKVGANLAVAAGGALLFAQSMNRLDENPLMAITGMVAGASSTIYGLRNMYEIINAMSGGDNILFTLATAGGQRMRDAFTYVSNIVMHSAGLLKSAFMSTARVTYTLLTAMYRHLAAIYKVIAAKIAESASSGFLATILSGLSAVTVGAVIVAFAKLAGIVLAIVGVATALYLVFKNIDDIIQTVGDLLKGFGETIKKVLSVLGYSVKSKRAQKSAQATKNNMPDTNFSESARESRQGPIQREGRARQAAGAGTANRRPQVRIVNNGVMGEKDFERMVEDKLKDEFKNASRRA